MATRDVELSRAEEARKTASDPTRLAALTLARDLARLARDATNRELLAIQARIKADQARYASPPAADADELERAAAKAERLAEVRRAEENLLRAEIDLGHAEADAQRPEQKDLDARRKAAADARTKRDAARAEVKAKQLSLHTRTGTYSPLGPVYPKTSSGRRLALAQWIANRGNPLTARVAINHIWMRHFGTPLVPSEFDFGVNGKPPTHPALLDWLAVELMESGWKMKSIHRLLVTSRAYRMRSTPASHDRNLAIDPSNNDYWRMNSRRMEAEAVRDNLFRVAGNLDPSLSGPDLDPASGLTSTRRSLYFRHAKEKRVLLLRLFDSSNVLSCYRRPESIVPQQALALANSPLSLAQARLLAKQISASQPETPESNCDISQKAFVAEAFERVLGRPPRPEEEAECARFLANQTERLTNLSRLTPFAAGVGASVAPAADPAQRARESLVHVLFNHNDFVTIH